MKKRTKKCIVCQKLFIPNKFAKNRQKFCSIECKSKLYYRKYYKHFTWKKEIKCAYCGKLFIPNTKHQVNCSKKCRGIKWKKKNWDNVLEWQREWFRKARKKDPERFRQFVKDRRHRIRANGGKFTLEEWNVMKKKYNYTCPDCKRKEPEIKLTIDHIIPLTKKGKHSKENIQPLCHSCNSRKKDHTSRPFKISYD